MTRRRTAFVASVALLLSLLAVAPPASAATGTTILTVLAEVGAPGGSQARTYTSPGMTLDAFPWGGVFQLQAYDPATGIGTSLTFNPPSGQVLDVGTYAGARATTDAGHAGLTYRYKGGQCVLGDDNGAFKILEIERNPSDMAITRFAAVFEHHCGSNPARARGSVYWNSTLTPRPRTSWTMSGDTTVLPGSAIQVAGVLKDISGVPLAGQAVTQWVTDLYGGAGASTARTTGAGGDVSSSSSIQLQRIQYAYEYAGDATHEPSIGVRTVAGVQRTSTLTASVPAGSLYVGETVTVTGTFRDTAGPVAGADILIEKLDELARATTAADGSFSADIVIPTRGSYSLSVHTNGTLLSAPAYVYVPMNVVARPSVITVAAPASVERLTPYDVTGTLVGHDGAPLGGVPVSLVRKDLAGTTTTVVTTEADGSYSLTDTPEVAGKILWAAKYLGSDDANQAPATKTATVVVPQLPTELAMFIANGPYVYGTRAIIRVHLGPTFNGRTVTLSAKRAGWSTPQIVVRGAVDSFGNLTTNYPMTANTTFTATFAGDYRYAPATVSLVRQTSAKVSVTAFGWFKKVGSIAVYHAGATPRFGFVVGPARPNGCLAVTAQRLSGGVWKTVASASCFHLDGNSQIVLALLRNSTPGKMRVRATVPSTSKTYTGSSPWMYYSFI